MLIYNFFLFKGKFLNPDLWAYHLQIAHPSLRSQIYGSCIFFFRIHSLIEFFYTPRGGSPPSSFSSSHCERHISYLISLKVYSILHCLSSSNHNVQYFHFLFTLQYYCNLTIFARLNNICKIDFLWSLEGFSIC